MSAGSASLTRRAQRVRRQVGVELEVRDLRRARGRRRRSVPRHTARTRAAASLRAPRARSRRRPSARSSGSASRCSGAGVFDQQLEPRHRQICADLICRSTRSQISIALLAMAVSWKPTPVRSAIVIWLALVRPGFRPATISPSSAWTRSARSRPASSAWRSSPNEAHCVRRSTTTQVRAREAGRRRAPACRASRNRARSRADRGAATRRGPAAARAGVAVMRTSASRQTASGVARRVRVEALVAHLAAVGVEVRAVRAPRDDARETARTSRRQRTWWRACRPEPMTPTVAIAAGASASAATAPAAPVRMSVRKPLSSSSATGHPGRRVEHRHQSRSARQSLRRDCRRSRWRSSPRRAARRR